jgi:hypothetical protein
MNRIVRMMTTNEDLGYATVPYVVAYIAVDEPSSAESFVEEVAEKTKLQRMCSPPDTAHLMVTIVGDLTAPDFARYWRACVAKDEVLRFWMEAMQVADVLQGDSQGELLSKASLLDDEE